MSTTWRNILLLSSAAIILIVTVLCRMLFLPSAFAFADGHPVDLAHYRGASPVGTPRELASADPVARGKYLTDAADCAACHTAKGGAPFAGGRPFKLPFGTLYTSNITPDRETGIGNWTDAEFLRAVHKGISRDGSRLYPAFPYASYALLTNDDVLAIRRYLATVPAVKHADRPNTFSFPYNQRWLMTFWGMFFTPSEPFRPIAERDPIWNRGAYLVEAAAHCGECHTPRTLMQAMNTRQKFAGGAAEGWNAYNITSDPVSGVGGWSAQDLGNYLKFGRAVGHGVASGPMAEAVEMSLSKLSASDIAAMAVYLRTVPPVRSHRSPQVAPAAPGQALAGYAGNASGRRLFAGACAGCHAWSGAGALVNEAQLTGNRAVNDGTAANVALMILNGNGKPSDGRQYMPNFRETYSDAEIAELANFVTARFGSKPSSVSAKDVSKMRDE